MELESLVRKECRQFFLRTSLSLSLGSWRDYSSFMDDGLTIECVAFLGTSSTKTLPSLFAIFGMPFSAAFPLRYVTQVTFRTRETDVFFRPSMIQPSFPSTMSSTHHFLSLLWEPLIRMSMTDSRLDILFFTLLDTLTSCLTRSSSSRVSLTES